MRCYNSMAENAVASPRNAVNPTMSVTVVRNIDADCAGSRPSDLRISGIIAPDNAAIQAVS